MSKVGGYTHGSASAFGSAAGSAIGLAAGLYIGANIKELASCGNSEGMSESQNGRMGNSREMGE